MSCDDHVIPPQGMSLSLHHHLLTSHTPSSSLEAFLSLVQQLSGFFQSPEAMAVTMAMGVDPADDRSLALLQRVSPPAEMPMTS